MCKARELHIPARNVLVQVMPDSGAHILTINGGSSSIRFALFSADGAQTKKLHAKIDGIGRDVTELVVSDSLQTRYVLSRKEAAAVTPFLVRWIAEHTERFPLYAVGHRVVHGMTYRDPLVVTPGVLESLYGLRPYDPEHLPCELELIRALGERFPKLPQIACFDTAFHQTMPRVATQLPLPRRYDQKGVRRYGFHGISYSFLLEELERLGDPAVREGRIVLAHLGNGASMAAVRDHQCIDTSMGFTPAAGLMMSTRAGDLDPGLVHYLFRTEQMDPKQFNDMVHHQAGLLGVSETSSDMRDLLQAESHDERAAEAVALFCYQAKRWLGALVAVLGGLDVLVFSGGIGENAPPIRSRLCKGLDFLSLSIDEQANNANAAVISSQASWVRVRVVHTDEETMIARSVLRTLTDCRTEEEQWAH